MSLISDALKRAQDEREKIKEPEDFSSQYEPGDEKTGMKRRIVVYSMLAVILAIIAVILIFISTRQVDSGMKILNVQARGTNQTPPSFPSSSPKTTVEKTPVEPAPASPTTPSDSSVTKASPAVTPSPALPTTSHSTLVNEPETSIKPVKPVSPSIESRTAIPPVHKETRPVQTSPGINPKKSRIEKLKESQINKEDAMFNNYMQTGDRLLADKDYNGASSKYREALKIKKTPGLYHKLYSAFAGMNNPVLARAYIDDGLKAFPDDYLLNKISVILYVREKKFPQALVNAQKALERVTSDPGLYTYAGLCYFHLKDYTGALNQFKSSLALDSGAVENYYYIGLIFDNKAEYGKALECYKAFLKLNGDDRNFKHRAWIVQRIGQLEEYIVQGGTESMEKKQ